MSDLFEKAKKEYPIIENLGVQFRNNPGGGSGMLEFWSSGEIGSKESPRPKDFDIAKPGIEVYDANTKPSDVMGDIASHYLVETDPVVSKVYQDFQKSLTDGQKATLKDQYEWAKKNEGEGRSYKEWEKTTGLPGAFRGYTFKQWPEEFNKKFYTDDQKKSFDEVVKYLKTPKKDDSPKVSLPAGMMAPITTLDQDIQTLRALK